MNKKYQKLEEMTAKELMELSMPFADVLDMAQSIGRSMDDIRKAFDRAGAFPSFRKGIDLEALKDKMGPLCRSWLEECE